MTLFYLAAAAGFLVALYLVLRPVFGPAAPFPENPRPAELKAELSRLKEELKNLSGEERVRALKRVAWLKRELGAYAEEAPQKARRVPAAALFLTAALVVGVGAALFYYTYPRLPGGTVTEALAVKELAELKALKAKAEKENTPEAWMAYADKAFALRDLERAAEGYAAVIKLDHANVKAYRRYGEILFMAGRPKEAAEILAVVTRVDEDPEGLLFLGNAYFQLGEYEKAIAAWQAYLDKGGEARERVKNLIATARARMNAQDPGEVVYAEKCAACHGTKGEGGIGPRLAKNPILNAPEAVREIIKNGRGRMPAVPLSEDEEKALIDYLKKL